MRRERFARRDLGIVHAPKVAFGVGLVFILSPANTSGRRAEVLMRPQAQFDLAVRLRTTGAPIAEIYTFMSGLYFRGKVAYSSAFAAPPPGVGGAHVIVPGLGMLPPDHVVDLASLREIAQVPVSLSDPRYTRPLLLDATSLRNQLGDDDIVVLLGSIATTKYVQPLGEIFGARLRFPLEFAGKGDMSRGSMMLKSAAAARPLTYVGIEEIP